VLTRAEKQERERLAKLEEEKHLTLQQFSERVFMADIQVRCSENTRSTYQSYLDKRILPALGGYKLRDITPAMVSALLLSMQKEGLSQSTCVKVYTILLGLFKTAYLQDHVDKNIMDKVQRPKPRKDEIKKQIEAYTAEELKVILDCLEMEPLKWQALIYLLCDTGMRRGECCGLQWSDIDFTSGKLTIRRTLNYTKDKGVYVDTTKNSRIRTIDLSADVLSLLKAWRADQADKCISLWVFNQDETPEDPMHPQSPTGYLAKFAKRYDIPDLHPHKLRHSFASVAITHGADVASVSEKLGHADKAVTLRMYTHADEQSIKRAGDIFREAVENG
jgi:integrase